MELLLVVAVPEFLGVPVDLLTEDTEDLVVVVPVLPARVPVEVLVVAFLPALPLTLPVLLPVRALLPERVMPGEVARLLVLLLPVVAPVLVLAEEPRLTVPWVPRSVAPLLP